MIGAVIPVLIGLAKSPIFTRYFTPEEYGYYSLAFVTFNYLSIGLYYWLTTCIFRYYLNYKKQNDLSKFYSTITLLYIASTVIIAITGLSLYYFTENHTMSVLFGLAAIHIIVAQLSSMILTIIKINGKAKAYNIIFSLKTLIAFLILCSLTFIFNFRIEALFINLIISEILLVTGLFIYFNTKIRTYILFKKMSFRHAKPFFIYGSAGLIISFCMIFINSSDRYIIALFYDIKIVGIYNQVFNLGLISLGALTTVYQNAINPEMIKQLEHNISNYFLSAKQFISQYIILILPVAVIFSLFAKEFAFVLLGEEFRVGYYILPWVFFSKFIEGATVLNNAKYKFENKLTFLVIVYISVALLNIGLNFILIPRFGYHYAVITTLISYLLLFFIVLRKDVYKLFTKDQITLLKPFIILLAIFVLIDKGGEHIFGRDFTFVETTIEGMIFLAAYALLYFKFANK